MKATYENTAFSEEGRKLAKRYNELGEGQGDWFYREAVKDCGVTELPANARISARANIERLAGGVDTVSPYLQEAPGNPVVDYVRNERTVDDVVEPTGETERQLLYAV
ncbi:hypothetical protein ACFL0V_00430 [Nanoarchaeota archaeon]